MIRMGNHQSCCLRRPCQSAGMCAPLLSSVWLKAPTCFLETGFQLLCRWQQPRRRVSTVFCVVFFFFFFTFEPTRQLSGKQHVGQLALTVRQPAVVAALAVEVVEADPAEVVGQGRDHHDPGRPAALQEPNEEVRQQEVAWKKKKERWWLIGTHELGC